MTFTSQELGRGHVTMAGKGKGHFRTRATLERQAVERTSDLQSLLATASNLSMNIYKHLQAQILETLQADAVPRCASTVKSIEMPALTVHPQWNAAAKISSISRFKNFTGFHCSDLSNLQQHMAFDCLCLMQSCSECDSIPLFHQCSSPCSKLWIASAVKDLLPQAWSRRRTSGESNQGGYWQNALDDDRTRLPSLRYWKQVPHPQLPALWACEEFVSHQGYCNDESSYMFKNGDCDTKDVKRSSKTMEICEDCQEGCHIIVASTRKTLWRVYSI